MRTLNRNKRKFYVANYLGDVEAVDENGFYTSERIATYTEPTEKRGNISPASGSIVQELFGSEESYDKIIVLDKPDSDIKESTHLWIDRLPEDGEHDYIVRRIATSLNSMSVAVSKVDVNV